MTLPTAGEHPIIDPIPAGYLEDGERFPRERRAMHLTTAGARESPSAREHEAGDQRAGQQDQEQAEQMVGRHHRDLDAERQADQAHLGEAAGRVAEHGGVEVEAGQRHRDLGEQRRRSRS